MEEIRATLEALRRTHFGLSVVSIAVLLLAIPTGPDFQAGLAQLRAVQEIFGASGYAQRCAELAGEHYAELWTSVRTWDGPTSALIGDETPLDGPVYCEVPTGESSLETVVDLLTGRERVTYAATEAEDIHAVLEATAGFGTLRGVSIRLAGDPPTTTTEVVVGQDIVGISVIDPAWTLDGEHSWVLRVALRSQTGFPTIDVPLGDATGFDAADSSILDWLSETEWGLTSLADSSRGEVSVLRNVLPFWAEVGASSVTDATRYLQSRADGQQGSVEVLGMNIDASLIVWGGPVIILALLGHLLAHLQLLTRIAGEGPHSVTSYPWIALIPGAPAALLRVGSLLVVPVAACATAALRAWPLMPLAAGWSVLAAVSTLGLAVTILSSLARVR